MFKKVLFFSLFINSMIFSCNFIIEKHKTKIQEVIALGQRIREFSKLTPEDPCLGSVIGFVATRAQDFLTEQYWIEVRFDSYNKNQEKNLKAWSQLSKEASENSATVAFLLADIAFLEKKFQN